MIDYKKVKNLEDRLKDILVCYYDDTEDWYSNAESLAERLIDNGIIIPPTKLSKELWDELQEYVYNRCVEEL